MQRSQYFISFRSLSFWICDNELKCFDEMEYKEPRADALSTKQ